MKRANIGKFYATVERAAHEYALFKMNNQFMISKCNLKNMEIELLDDTAVRFIGMRDERDWNQVAGFEFCYVESYDLDAASQLFIMSRVRGGWKND